MGMRPRPLRMVLLSGQEDGVKAGSSGLEELQQHSVASAGNHGSVGVMLTGAASRHGMAGRNELLLSPPAL